MLGDRGTAVAEAAEKPFPCLLPVAFGRGELHMKQSAQGGAFLLEAKLIKDKAEAVGHAEYGFAAQMLCFKPEHLGKAWNGVLMFGGFLFQLEGTFFPRAFCVQRSGFFQLIAQLEQALCRVPAVGTEGGGVEGLTFLFLNRNMFFQDVFPRSNALAAMLGRVGQAQLFLKQGKEAHRAAYLHAVHSVLPAAEMRYRIGPCAAVHISAEYDFHKVPLVCGKVCINCKQNRPKTEYLPDMG